MEVVAKDGFTGFKTAAAEEIPAAVAVMDPFTWVRLAGDALNDCRRRVQQTTAAAAAVRTTAAWSTCAAPPSASATSPTTSPDPYSRQADSDPDYTLHW